MGEYIDRSELLGIERLLDTDILRASKTASTIYDQMMFDIEHIPSADVAPVKHGKWEYEQATINTLARTKCSICEWWSLDPSIDGAYHYCPNCGSKMDL